MKYGNKPLINNLNKYLKNGTIKANYLSAFCTIECSLNITIKRGANNGKT